MVVICGLGAGDDGGFNSVMAEMEANAINVCTNAHSS